LGAILGFFKLLYEHKEKIILAVLIVAVASVGYGYWKKLGDGTSPTENGNGPGAKPPPPPPPPPPPVEIPKLGNVIPLEEEWKLTDESIFTKPVPVEQTEEETQQAEWPKIEVKSIFDATKSGNFFAIIEVNGKREFLKEGAVFNEFYAVKRIDGVRNCLTIVKRRSESGENEKEFCK